MSSHGNKNMEDDEEISRTELDDDDESEDEDYVPSEHEVSEEDNSGDEEDFVPEDGSKSGQTKKRKGKKATDVNPRLARNKQAGDEDSSQLKQEIEKEKTAHKEQKEKERADALWASFMSDVGPKKAVKKQQEKTTTNIVEKTTPKPKATVKVTQVFDFAGETVRLEKQVAADSKEAKRGHNSSESTSTPSPASGAKRPGGLGAVLSFINKKQKISTLDKSKLDWEKYKSEAGIADELKIHTNSKASYLERKEFLERTDQRRFEKEREARLASASKR